MSAVAGVDGIPGGWIVAILTEDNHVAWADCANAGEVRDATKDCRFVGVDVPMGLPDDGPRSCDVQARKLLGRAGSSVFPTPRRAVLAARTYADAVAMAERDGVKSLSKQTWNIVAKIREWDEVLRAERPEHILEVHPEVSFRELAGAALDRKLTARGAWQRMVALGGMVDLADALSRVPTSAAALDDVLDALACAWTARRRAAGQHRELGDGTDSEGLTMRITV